MTFRGCAKGIGVAYGMKFSEIDRVDIVKLHLSHYAHDASGPEGSSRFESFLKKPHGGTLNPGFELLALIGQLRVTLEEGKPAAPQTETSRGVHMVGEAVRRILCILATPESLTITAIYRGGLPFARKMTDGTPHRHKGWPGKIPCYHRTMTGFGGYRNRGVKLDASQCRGP